MFRHYDAALDGQRFVVIRDGTIAGGTASPDPTVVLDGFEELRERMGSD